MAIPKEILSVERPKGTIVKHSGKKYYVIKRTSRYDKGRRVPVELGIVGEIINGAYVPKKDKMEKGVSDVKDYGNVVITDHFGREIYRDLLEVFNSDDAMKIYLYALLQSVYGDITARDMKLHYETSFASELYPGVPCSRQTIGSFLDLLGRHLNKINEFMKNRLKNIDKNAPVIVDGMLKGNNSETNSFSAFSRKGKVKGSKDISLLYAIDYQKGEPLASAVYPGNMLDQTAFQDFAGHFSLDRGVLIGDKGFVLNDEMRKSIALKSNLKYLIPIKRNLKEIDKLHLLDFDAVIKSKEAVILCRKSSVNNRFYYSFKNVQTTGKEAHGFLQKNCARKTIDTAALIKKYQKQENSFGTIVFESNLDFTPEEIYKMYEHRWDIEEVFRFYKNILEIDSVGVQQDTRLYGEEFINFLSTIITCRMRNHFDRQELFNDYSFRQIMLHLSKIKKVRSELTENQWCDSKHVSYIDKIIEKIAIDI